MKALIALLLSLSLVPVSIAGMVWGWGLTAENWGWVSFSYLLMFFISIISAAID